MWQIVFQLHCQCRDCSKNFDCPCERYEQLSHVLVVPTISFSCASPWSYRVVSLLHQCEAATEFASHLHTFRLLSIYLEAVLSCPSVDHHKVSWAYWMPQSTSLVVSQPSLHVCLLFKVLLLVLAFSSLLSIAPYRLSLLCSGSWWGCELLSWTFQMSALSSSIEFKALSTLVFCLGKVRNYHHQLRFAIPGRLSRSERGKVLSMTLSRTYQSDKKVLSLIKEGWLEYYDGS